MLKNRKGGGASMLYEYTGMRYVPVFADPPEWSSANSYEPLEIVIHEGNSYTSKTFVPVGIDISNSAYWVLTGNYNAQVESYRKEVEALKASTEKGFSGIRAYVAQEVDTTAVYIGNSYTEGVGGTSSGGLFGQTSKMFTNAFKYTSSGAGFLINSVGTRINSGNIEIYGIQYNNSFPTDKSKLPISTYSVYNPKTFILPHSPYYVQK